MCVCVARGRTHRQASTMELSSAWYGTLLLTFEKSHVPTSTRGSISPVHSSIVCKWSHEIWTVMGSVVGVWSAHLLLHQALWGDLHVLFLPLPVGRGSSAKFAVMTSLTQSFKTVKCNSSVVKDSEPTYAEGSSVNALRTKADRGGQDKHYGSIKYLSEWMWEMWSRI